MKVTKEGSYTSKELTDIFSKFSTAAFYISGSGSADLIHTDEGGNTNTIQTFIPFTNEVMTPGKGAQISFEITGVSEAAPMYIEVRGIK